MSVSWPGRLEVVRQTGNQTILFDVAHNPQALSAIADYVKTLRGSKALVLILGQAKDLVACLRSCAGDFDHIFAVETEGEPFHQAADVIVVCQSLSVPATVYNSWDDLKAYETVIVAGSHRLFDYIDLKPGLKPNTAQV